jgi:hypothetical protein
MKAKTLVCTLLTIAAFAFNVCAQKRPAAGRRVIFAVLGDGSSIEPIGYLDSKGKMLPAVDGGSERNVLNAFHKTYFAKGKSYPLIFGGKASGNVTVVSSDPSAECGNFEGKVRTMTTRTVLKGNVMALATDAKLVKPASGIRRLPTTAERSEIEALVRAELMKNGIGEATTTNLRSHNLTALDVDSDANAELVGTYWVETSPKERGLLYFIAQRAPDGKYAFGYSEFRKASESDTMSEDIKDIDGGVYHERLLDIFDVDGDGISEVFSYVQSFEGAGFNVYKRTRTGWTKHYEGSNYHCGY